MKKSPPDARQYFKELHKQPSAREGKIKVAGYIRLSTEAQKARGYDRDQRAAITGFLLEHIGKFIEPVRFYEDVDVKKGELAPHRRPGLMMALDSGRQQTEQAPHRRSGKT